MRKGNGCNSVVLAFGGPCMGRDPVLPKGWNEPSHDQLRFKSDFPRVLGQHQRRPMNDPENVRGTGSGLVAVVTGASRGLGAGLVIAFSDKGLPLCLRRRRGWDT